MTDIEKTIRGLDCHIHMKRGEPIDCMMEHCPYWDEDDDTGLSVCNVFNMLEDVRELLKVYESAPKESW